MRTIRVIISGKVQGVGFRYSTNRKAQQLKVRGWVKNRPEGTVEAVFQGEEEEIAEMLQWCNHGPSGAVVATVQLSTEESPSSFSNFSIYT